MKKILHALVSEELTIVLLVLFSVSLSLYPTIYSAIQAGPDTVFPLVHNNHPDFYANLHFMRQGYDGHLFLTSRMTPETFAPQLVQTLLASLGFLAKILHIDIPVMYTVARIIFGAILLIAIYFLTRDVLKKPSQRLLSCFFAFLGTTFWWFTATEAGNMIYYPIGYWTEFDAIRRITFLPHHLVGTIFVVLSVLLLGRYLTHKTTTIIPGALCAALAGFFNPASLINFYFTLSIFSLLFIGLYRNDKKILLQTIINLFVVGIISILPLIHLYMVTNAAFPWTSYRDWEAKQYYPAPLLDYILMLGPAGILSLFAVPSFINSKSMTKLLLIGWLLGPFLPLFVFKDFFIHVFPMSNMRFFQAAHYIPVGIMGGYGFFVLVELLSKLPRVLKLPKLPRTLLSIFLFVPLFSYSAYYWNNSINVEKNSWGPNIYNIYLLKDFYHAFDFLNEHTQENSIVLSGGFLGNIIPAFTHNKTFLGHPVITYKAEEKGTLLSTFLTFKNPVESKQIINTYGINYIFFTLDTGQPTQEFASALDLQKVYENPSVTIYKVNE